VVLAVAELIHIDRKVADAHMVVLADDAALEQRPETLDAVGVPEVVHVPSGPDSPA